MTFWKTYHVLEYFSVRIGAEFHLVTDWRIDFSLVCGSNTALSEDNLDELNWYVRPKNVSKFRMEFLFHTIFIWRYKRFSWIENSSFNIFWKISTIHHNFADSVRPPWTCFWLIRCSEYHPICRSFCRRLKNVRFYWRTNRTSGSTSGGEWFCWWFWNAWCQIRKEVMCWICISAQCILTKNIRTMI